MKRILFGLLLALMGGPILLWAMKAKGRNEACDSWPVTRGEVLKSAAVRDSSRIRGGGYNKFVRQDILYRYTVNSKSYESSTITFGTPTIVGEGETVPPVGSIVTVHYDPDEPATSCLTGGVSPQDMNIVTYSAGAFLLAGIISIISGVMGRRNKRASA